MTEIVLRVPGQPTGKGRPRFSPKSGRAYTPKKTMAAESRVFQAWQLAGEQTLPMDVLRESDEPVTAVVERMARILPDDRVVVELSPYDLTRGRIVYRYK